MKKKWVVFLIVFIAATNITVISSEISSSGSKHIPTLATPKTQPAKSVYDSLRLREMGLSENAYNYAMRGFEQLEEKGILKNDSVLTIVDFDQPSYKKRMYIIDVKNYKILFNTWTAHGKNTGTAEAKNFSNTVESNMSSLGLYVTDQTYSGKHGYSLRLVGVEKGNSNALERAIVVHGAKYVNQATINTKGYIGRSHGCPAVPNELSKPIIDKIKGGSCLFIYNKTYHQALKV